jgi:hypothetical protein
LPVVTIEDTVFNVEPTVHNTNDGWAAPNGITIEEIEIRECLPIYGCRLDD